MTNAPLGYYGGVWGALLPFAVFVGGVVTLALSGAPDERGFWPILILALTASVLLARDRTRWCEVVITGMSRPIVMIMIMAWSLASIIGVLMAKTGFVDALLWAASTLDLEGRAFVGASFLICCVVSTATGTSFGTILLCGPLLYPAGGALGSSLPALAGAILGGATFGDSISPLSDTSIASALSQETDVAGTVRSRVKYVVPAAVAALPIYVLVGDGGAHVTAAVGLGGSPRGLPMILAPLAVIVLLLKKRHLLEGLLAGILAGVVVGMGAGLLSTRDLLTLDVEHFSVKSLVIDGVNRSVGISFFTIFLLGLVAALEASGVFQRLVDASAKHVKTVRAAEGWIAGAVGILTCVACHSIVAILTVAELTRRTGERFDIHPYRRANLLDLSVSSLPFTLPYFIPVILTANTTASGVERGLARVPPLEVGLHNFFSFAVFAILVVAIATGYGRRFRADALSDGPGRSPAEPDARAV